MKSKSNDEIPYLELDPEIAEEIKHDKETGAISPYAFRDEDIVRREDLPHDRATLTRPAFMRDVEKIVNVPAYNRYAGKTQVFSFVNNDDITRRGLHVQLVARVARGIGRLLGLNTDLIEAIALGHDVGHTPFGHAGERFLSKCYQENTGMFFNHNVHSVRVLDKLYPRNISLQTLDGVISHNGEFATQVLSLGDVKSFDDLDALEAKCIEDEQTIAHLRPSTLEGCVVRVSDMIAYVGKDRMDALQMEVIDSLEGFDSEVIGKDNARIINNLTVDIVNNSYGKDRICMSDEVFQDLKLAKKQNFDRIYIKEGMINGTHDYVNEMFQDLYAVLLDDVINQNRKSPIFRHHIDKLSRISRNIDSDDYANEEPNRIVVDYMASMTDGYFDALYKTLFPGREKAIKMRGYFAEP